MQSMTELFFLSWFAPTNSSSWFSKAYLYGTVWMCSQSSCACLLTKYSIAPWGQHCLLCPQYPCSVLRVWCSVRSFPLRDSQPVALNSFLVALIHHSPSCYSFQIMPIEVYQRHVDSMASHFRAAFNTLHSGASFPPFCCVASSFPSHARCLVLQYVFVFTWQIMLITAVV